MSQRQLAERLGIDPAVLSRRMAAAKLRPWTTEEIDRIAQILGVPVDRLLGIPAAAGAA
jgi:transcriptional regulator with XRE-family HTH domain